jgi:hypothetical protein
MGWTLKNRLWAVVIVGAAIFILFALVWSVNVQRRHRAQSRSAISDLFNSIALGDSTDRTVAIAEMAIANHPDWRLSEYPETLCVETPLELGATNWIICIALHNDCVAAIGIRTSDSVRIRPDAAPEDRVSATARERWQEEFLWTSPPRP